MANRTTYAEVIKIIDTDLAQTSVEAQLDAANLFVTNHLQGSGLNTATLTMIEKYICAHFMTAHDMRSSKEKAGEVEQDFQYKIGFSLNQSKYGQIAMDLDSTGTLKNIANTKRKASLNTIGVEYEY